MTSLPHILKEIKGKKKLQDILSTHIVVYKKVKVLKEHCNICREPLWGNGSIASPYKCSCGQWEAERTIYGEWGGNYKIKMIALYPTSFQEIKLK